MGVGVSVGVSLGVGEGVRVAVWLGVGVLLGVSVSVGVPVAVGVAVRVGVAVSVDVAVSVGVALSRNASKRVVLRSLASADIAHSMIPAVTSSAYTIQCVAGCRPSGGDDDAVTGAEIGLGMEVQETAACDQGAQEILSVVQSRSPPFA